MELILVKVLRAEATQFKKKHTGLLAGLTDPVTACALRATHKDVAHSWTISGLARLCGVSRSTFATRFHSILGSGSIEYFQHWRMALAKG